MIVFQVLSSVFSSISIIFCVITFATNRKDKAVKDTKESHQDLIEYQLKELKEDVKAILNKLDRYDKDIDDRIDKAIELHIKMYHSSREK